MKKLQSSILFFTVLLLIISCEENISPFGELSDKYSVNFILRGDTTMQTAYISKMYAAENMNPDNLTEDPFVPGAIVTIKYTDSGREYRLNDTADVSNIVERFNSPSQYYYLDNFTPSPGKEIILTVKLPNGDSLSSNTKLPDPVTFDQNGTTPFIPGPYIGNDTNYINIAWLNSDSELVNAAKVNLVYYYREISGEKTKHKVQVPLNFIYTNNDREPVFVEMSFNNNLRINRSFLEEVLYSISEGNDSKARFSIAPLEIEIFSFDENLTRYYSADLFFDFGFTVRNYPGDLTNIEGGYGFFGSYSHTKKIIKFDSQYLLKTFGYLREVTN